MDNLINTIKLRIKKLENEEFDDNSKLEFLNNFLYCYDFNLDNFKFLKHLRVSSFLTANLLVNTDMDYNSVDNLIKPIKSLIDIVIPNDEFCDIFNEVIDILYEKGIDYFIKNNYYIEPFNNKNLLKTLLEINNRELLYDFVEFIIIKAISINIYFLYDDKEREKEYKKAIIDIRENPSFIEFYNKNFEVIKKKAKELNKMKNGKMKYNRYLIDLYKKLLNDIFKDDFITYRDYFDNLEDDIKLLLEEEILKHNKQFYDKATNDILKNNDNLENIFKINGFNYLLLNDNDKLRLKNCNINNLKEILKIINEKPFYIYIDNKNFIDILLFSNIEILQYIKKLYEKEYIDTLYIHNNIGILLSSNYQNLSKIPCLYERLQNNINTFINKKLNIKNIRKTNPNLLLINEKELKQRLFLFKQYHINLDKQDIIDYSFITNDNVFDIIDNFIELGLKEYIKNNIETVSNDSDNIIKRIYISSIISYNIWNNNGKLSHKIITGHNFPIRNEDLDNYYINYTTIYTNKENSNYFNNKLDYNYYNIIFLLDNYYLYDENYLFGDIIISRNKVIRNISSLISNKIEINENTLLMAIINNSILDDNQIKTIKYEINKLLNKKQKTL